jgi:hypothetical protein
MIICPQDFSHLTRISASTSAVNGTRIMTKSALSLRSAFARHAAASLVALGALAAGPALADAWTEVGDAGQTQATAQITAAGSMPALTSIGGSFSSQFDVDLFVVRISNPAAFSATTVGTGLKDTQLFLFTMSGKPVYMNDDDANLSATADDFLSSTLPAGSANGPMAAGLYLLGISLSGNDPVNAVNNFLFAGGLSTDVRGPASGLSPTELADFSGATKFDEQGAYTITLTGADAAIPEPATGALVVLAFGLCALTSAKKGRRTAAEAAAA